MRLKGDLRGAYRQLTVSVFDVSYSYEFFVECFEIDYGRIEKTGQDECVPSAQPILFSEPKANFGGVFCLI